MKNYFINSRSALGFVLKSKKYRNLSKSILLPDYICEEVVNFFDKRSFSISFYKIKNNLEADLKDLKKKKTKKFTFILFVHFFGYPGNINEIKNFSKKRNLVLIEDNAHGYGGIYRDKALGTFGEIGISSPHKTIKGLYSGGILYGKFKKIQLEKLRPNIFSKLKKIIKIKLPIISMFKEFFNNFLTSSGDLNKSLKIDDFSYDKLIKLNLKKYKLIKKNYFLKLTKILEKNNIYIFHKDYSYHLNPWFLIIKKSKRYEKKLLILSKKHKFDLITWPSKFKNKRYKRLNNLKKNFYFIDLSFTYDGKKPN
jgi:hypothetical protein